MDLGVGANALHFVQYVLRQVETLKFAYAWRAQQVDKAWKTSYFDRLATDKFRANRLALQHLIGLFTKLLHHCACLKNFKGDARNQGERQLDRQAKQYRSKLWKISMSRALLLDAYEEVRQTLLSIHHCLTFGTSTAQQSSCRPGGT